MSTPDARTPAAVLASVGRSRRHRSLSDVQLTRITDSEICFAHRLGPDVPWSAALTVCLAMWSWNVGLQSWRGAALALVVSAFAAATLYDVLWRESVVLDFHNRTWSRRRGLLGLRPKRRAGGFTDFDGLILNIESSSKSQRSFPVWVVRLAVRDEPAAVAVGGFANEGTAYEWLTALAGTVRLPVIDRTGGRERRLAWNGLDQPILSPDSPPLFHATANRTPLPPIGSAIRVADSPAQSITLPSSTRGFTLRLMTAWCLTTAVAMIGFAATMWRNSLPLTRVSSGAALIVPLVIGMIGALLAVVIIGNEFSREELMATHSAVVLGRRRFGRFTPRKTIAKRSIEEISVKPLAFVRAAGWTGPTVSPDDSRTYAGSMRLFIRSRTDVVEIGRTLTRQELEWLRATLLTWLGA